MAKELELVVNPAAGGGKAARCIEPARRALEREGWAVTVHRCASRSVLRETVKNLGKELSGSSSVLAIMGGDGTFHDAVDTLTHGGETSDAQNVTLAVFPAGTGGDLAARTLGIPSGVDAIAQWLSRAEPMAFDLGRVEPAGMAPSVFANIASAGISGRVDALVSGGPAWLSGKAAYLAASVRAIAGWKSQAVTVTVDGEKIFDGRVHFVAACNGRAFGGGMIIAPNARCDDGLFEVVIAEDTGLAGVLQTMPKLYSGTHLGARGVIITRGSSVTVDTHDPDVMLDVDGEAMGKAPVVFTVLPRALRLLQRR